MKYYNKSTTYNKIILPFFIRFLKKEHSLQRYMKNLNSDNGYNLRIWYYENSDVSHFLFKDIYTNNGYNLLNKAFRWSETEEGHAFWQDLNNKWKFKLYVCLHNLVRY